MDCAFVELSRPPGITGEPYPLAVEIDGERLGEVSSGAAPLFLVTAGEHRVAVDMDGYRSAAFLLSLEIRQIAYLRCVHRAKTLTRLVKLFGKSDYFVLEEYRERTRLTPEQMAHLMRRG